MRILMTGGCGFIGANFVYLIAAERPGWTVCNVDALTYAGNPANVTASAKALGDRYRFERTDIADAPAMRRIFADFRPEAVVNFAAESHVDRSIADAAPFIHTNIFGTQVLLDLAREMGIPRFVQVSTDEVYGSLGPKGLFTETAPLAPNSPYSASKASADLLCRAWFETYGFPVIVTRCSNNYGPYQFPEKLIPLMYMRAMRDEPLPVYGDGANVRDWIFVEDHCRGVLAALERGRPGAIYNFGGNAEKPNLDVVRTILSLCGKPESLIRFVTDRPGHDRRYAMDYSLAARELGFAPSVTFEEGIRRTLAWYAGAADWLEGVTSGAYRTFMREQYGDRL